MTYKPVVLCVLDGWGCSEKTHGNAIAAANLPYWHTFFEHYPWTTLDASGEEVGLPKGIMGNSEVGHLNIGSGRVVPQGVVVIDDDIASGAFAKNATLRDALVHAKANGGKLHLMGLLSDGQVHSSIVHLFSLIDAAVAADVPIAIDCFLDGRDTPPRSALTYVDRLEHKLASVERQGSIASVCGRFYAMDRDKRWDRTKRAYDMLTDGTPELRAGSASDAVKMGYDRGEDDEFVQPTIVGDVRSVDDGDACIFFNFRPDRARQLTTAFDAGTTIYFHGDFHEFESKRYEKLVFATMTKYDENYTNPVLFGPRPQFGTFGDVIAKAGLRQLRLAETEKYAHVTYFFNGGREEPLPGEDRKLIPSDRSVATYDLAPAMRAREITEFAVDAIKAGTYDVVVMNYANADMVGHTGKWRPTIAGIEVLDECLERLAEATLAAGGLLAITADHGNAEEKIDAGGNPLTAHTTNPVPLLLIANHLQGSLASGGKLGDVAPTLLHIMGLSVPEAMTGTDLFSS